METGIGSMVVRAWGTGMDRGSSEGLSSLCLTNVTAGSLSHLLKPRPPNSVLLVRALTRELGWDAVLCGAEAT